MVIKIIQAAIMAYNHVKYHCDSIDQPSEPVKEYWHHALQEQQDMMIKTVIFIFKNPNATLSEIHNNWMDNKKADGWIFGTWYDWERQITPKLIPYHQLTRRHQQTVRIIKDCVEEIRGISI